MQEYIIYKIYILGKPELCYIGSTKNFRTRKTAHKTNCLKHYPIKLYTMINENGGWNNCEMVEIDKIMVKDKIEAHIREEELRLSHNANMNSNKAYNKKEDIPLYYKKYVEDNYEHLQDLWKNQYTKNKQFILQSRAKGYQYKKAWKELCNIEI